MGRRIFDIARKVEKNYPKEDFLATKEKGVWSKTSTEEFIRLSDAFSRGLIKLGIKKGEKIALITTSTRTEWAIADRGILQIGGITVPVYPTITPADYEFIFKDAKIRYCIVSDRELLSKVKHIKSLTAVYSFDPIENTKNWKEILELGRDFSTQNEVQKIADTIQDNEVATIIYTSGTTGKPKGVMLSHRNIVSNIEASQERIPLAEGCHYKEVRALSFLPICHIFERMLFYLYQDNGFSIYFAESLDKIGENIKEVKPHYMAVVPRLLEKIYDKIYEKGTSSGKIKALVFLWAVTLLEKKENISAPSTWKEIIADRLVFKKWREALGGRIVALISGSAALSLRLNKIFQNAGIPILEGYGLTETSPVIAVNSFDKIKPGTVGHVLKNLEIKIEPDGEITVKGPSVFVGYFNNPELTENAFTEDGFFKTGDIGHIDEEGYLKITDRKKEMFKTSGGKYIAPQIIENLAKTSKFIEQIMVVGEGEKMPCAIIQPDFNFAKNWAKRHHLKVPASNKEISQMPELKERIKKEIEKINKELGNWEQIKKIELSPEIWSVEGGELTPTLKLKRKAVKEKYQNLYLNLYS
ncbi:MAG: long-chain fatty acid--CoA ligase [Bergeyella sp.]|nr:long-chain fatty acid--CoA ligase [Bergeyella sp.]